MLGLIFSPTDFVYTCQAFENGSTVNPMMRKLEEYADAELATQSLYAVNPLTKLNANPKPNGSIRHRNNVATMRNFVFESDSYSLEQQRALIPELEKNNIPIRLITSSAGKSLHYVISLVDTFNFGDTLETQLENYRHSWNSLQREIEIVACQHDMPNFCDQATKDCVRLTRTPGAIRSGTDKVQQVVATGAYITSAQLNEICLKYTRKTSIKLPAANFTPDMTLDRFEREMKAASSLQAVRGYLLNPAPWASPNGMYPRLFRYTLWLIDRTGVPKETLLNYLRKYTFPTILNTGYTRDLEKPIKAAYEYKGLL